MNPDALAAWRAALAAKAKAQRNRRGKRRTALQAGRTLGVRKSTPKAKEDDGGPQ